MNALPEFFDVSEEVEKSLARGRAVVALESTIVSHGMPAPQNLETALTVEEIVRGGGAVPATIAIIDGRVRVGITRDELERLAHARDVLKLSSADLPAAIAHGRTGSTTVAATMRCAHTAGIGVFATGGIGGVHRGAKKSFDVSADLYELARTPVAVVCAGAKALLDLEKTFELLETLGVPVVAYRSDHIPAFWSASSALRATLRAESPADLARFVRIQDALDLPAGIVIANPIPMPDEISFQEMNGFIESVVREAAREQITGKAVTPWMLNRINEQSQGRALRANIAAVRNNARLAAELAIELSTQKEFV